jgi:predicted metal-dependent HD superfamily phosphohydrolase
VKLSIFAVLLVISYSVIYDPKAADNEERSAELFMDFAKECFDEVIYYVGIIIIKT